MAALIGIPGLLVLFSGFFVSLPNNMLLEIALMVVGIGLLVVANRFLLKGRTIKKRLKRLETQSVSIK